MRALRSLACAAVLAALLAVPAVARAEPWWKHRIDQLTAGHAISVAVGNDGTFLYRRRPTVRRAPASNEKLLLSMAILGALGPDFQIQTRVAAASPPVDGVIDGDVWIVGRGDPLIDAAGLAALAKQIAAAGVTRIQGSVIGSTSYFGHDWFAPGWRDDFPRDEVALPTALTFQRNQVHGVHIHRPELLAARTLTHRLELHGVAVHGRAAEGRAPAGLSAIAKIESQPLIDLLHRQNIDSVNFIAEVLGKLLGARTMNPDGAIAKGASAIEAWAQANGVGVTAFDSSGLSYANRIDAVGMLRLLWAADAAPWGGQLRLSLPHANEGTLGDRLRGVHLRAKTGTLKHRSALSGWVWLERGGTWGEFSILSQGMSYTEEKRLEDRIVRLIAGYAR